MSAVILEGVASPPSPIDQFVAYGRDRNERPTDEALRYLADEGYIFDVERANVTDKGFELLEERGVALSVLNILTLGQDLHIPTQDATGRRFKLHLKQGSQTLVLFGGRNKRTGLREWYDVRAGDELPIIRVYANSKHVFSEHKWPATWPINGTTTFAP